ncbi:hypothetical protein D3C81_1622170 [compost metagenome]
MAADHFVTQRDQVEPADAFGNAEHFFRGELRSMDTLPGGGIRAQQLTVCHGDLVVREGLAHLV